MQTRRSIAVGALGILLGLSGYASAGAPIERVVVYADRAEVTRGAVAKCEGGKAVVDFEHLPTAIDKRTLRAEASGKAKAIGTTSRVVALEENRDERVARLSEELWKLRDEIRAKMEKAEGHRERAAGLSAYEGYFGALLSEQVRDEKADTGNWARTIDRIRDGRLEAAGKEREIAIELRKLNRKRERLERRIQALAPSRVAEALDVSVSVDCGGEASARVKLSYVVPGVTWRPEYDLRFLPGGGAKTGRGKVELTVAAVVQQASGEDWEQVELVLSTAKPRLGSEAPYPARITIQGHEVGKEKVLVGKMERREKLRGPAGEAAAGPEAVDFEDKGQSIQLKMPRKVTVRSDGRPYWMPVDVARGKGESKLVCVPKLRPYVYQAVSFENPARYPLLAGRVHVYRSGSYVGDTRLEYSASGEPLEMSLGIDEELKVERKDLVHENREAGFASTTQHLARAYWIQVTNNSKARVPVEVRENIPVSKAEQVRVEIEGKTSKGYQIDAHRGFLTWTLPISPGKKSTVTLAYTIHLPEDWKVQIR